MISPIRISIVDDHSLFREGLHYLLQHCDWAGEVQEATNGKEFLDNLENFVPDIVLMDIEMPRMNGVDATRMALARYPDLRIIALSMYSEEVYYSEMIEAGAKGFLLKNAPFQEVEAAIREVYMGRNFFSPEILASIVDNLNRKPLSHGQINELTAREQEVLYGICRGLSNQEIAEQLDISKRTVDKHRENILLKSQSKNTAELVVFAIRKGYFEV